MHSIDTLFNLTALAYIIVSQETTEVENHQVNRATHLQHENNPRHVLDLKLYLRL